MLFGFPPGVLLETVKVGAKANQEEMRFKRTNRLYSIIILDIDQVKSVNDTYGHECGDKVLVAVSLGLEKFFELRISRRGGEVRNLSVSFRKPKPMESKHC